MKIGSSGLEECGENWYRWRDTVGVVCVLLFLVLLILVPFLWEVWAYVFKSISNINWGQLWGR